MESISLSFAGIGDEVDADGNVEIAYLDGKPVTTTIGRTPLEAWSNCLIKLGLVDEVILDMAMEAYKFGKEEEFKEDCKKSDSRRQSKSTGNADDGTDDKDGTESNGDVPVVDTEDAIVEDDREPISQEELKLRDEVAALKMERAIIKQADETAMVELADARIKLLGRLMCNPFGVSDTAKSHQASWMAAAVRKEKTKMGSTGNKRKIVTATDLLERNNSFYSPEVEALLEGLPGSEYCISYQYQANRGAVSASRQWLQEQRLIQEREAKRRMKLGKEAQVKASLVEEKELKRKRREDERDARKRQKQEEEEDKKKTRIEERLSRLKVHVEERLFKEASFQREKVVLLLAKNLNKEFNRRRKAAETLSRERIEDFFQRKAPHVDIQELPPLATQYDEDIIRIWDFISTFGNFFVGREYMITLPSIDDLQIAIDTLRGSNTKMNKAEATTFVTELAVSLCKPLSAGITRMLFASLIALNPALQKDFGAAFFNEVNATKTKEKEEKSQSDVLLPVDTYTWKEIARIAFQSDALGELGYARHDAAHLLRGYRSAGHPNSKEARRLRRVEDFSIALLRQTLNEKQLESSGSAIATKSIRIDVPGSNACDNSHWTFYLHNIKSMTEPLDYEVFLDNLRKGIEVARLDQSGADQTVIKEMEAILVDLSATKDMNGLQAGRKSVMSFLDNATGEIFSQESYGTTITKEENDFTDKANLTALQKILDSKLYRARMGELKKLKLTPKELKELTRIREEYMSDALRLKEEMKRQEMKDAGEEDDYDEDDDDEEDEDHGISDKSAKGVPASTAELIPDEEAKVEDIMASSNATNINRESVLKAETEVLVEPGAANEQKIGKESQHDDFCGDIPSAPELIRRCIAVLRTLSQTGPAEPFIFPVDPQTNPGYYDMLLQPMCMREVGLRLQKAANKYQEIDETLKESFLERTVADFARNVRLIGRNCLSYANAGPMIISAGGEMLRIFERLLLDWVLAPDEHLTPLDSLDDDLCVEPHPTDLEATVLLCDGCEGNFNVSRLDPPLLDIPKGDWYCPRCLTGRWWGDLDPRIGKEIVLKGFGGASGRIQKCLFVHREQDEESPSLMYEVEIESGSTERVTLNEIDEALGEAGTRVPKIRCLEAVAESRGYGAGIDHGLRHDLVPVLLNPKISDAASQVMLSSSVFRDSVAAASTLLINDPQEMTASEWLRLLALLIMKCSSSDIMQNVASEMEEEAAERLAKRLESISKITEISQVLPRLSDEAQFSLGEGTSMEVQASLVEAVEDVPKDKFLGNIRTIEIPSNGKGADFTSVVEATAIEVPSMHVESVPSHAHVAYVEAEAGHSEEDDFKSRRSAALAEKNRRQKAREDSIAAFCIKNQLRSTVASFEHDNFSQVVESTLATNDPGLSFSSTRCRGTFCDFCTLADTSLGANFVRIPNADEWDELVKYGAKSRKTNLIADLGAVKGENAGCHKLRKDKKLMKVSLRIGDDLVADEKSDREFDQIPDGGMLEFLPRNPEAFQHELRFRYESGLPFVTGSLTGHECCALAAHNARKVKVVYDYKERQAALAELDEGNTCGRTLEIGKDTAGRSYWVFNSEPGSLFVCLGSAKWYKYSEPETIASVIISLGKDPVLRDLKRAFPKASELLRNGAWTDLLLKRRFTLKAIKSEGDDGSAAMEMDINCERDDVYVEKENILVESKDGSQLWDATVKGVAKNAAGKVTGYCVHYVGWSSRFDEWVSSSRVVEANENNKKIQESMRKDAALSREGLPPALENMEAISYLHAKDRARGNTPLPDFGRIAHVAPNATEDDTIFATMKAAILAIEAALPIGSVNNTEGGTWSPGFSSQWREMVQKAEGSWNLMRCVILMEDIISEEWMKEQIGHLRSCLPSRWKALDEACPSSLALRIFLLDRCIAYGTVDKRKFKSGSKSKK